jgi:heterodisulfide reductase subunit A
LAHSLSRTTGFVGNFTSTLQARDGSTVDVRHGAAIISTGGEEYRGPEYGYGTHPRLVTGQDMESILAHAEGRLERLEERQAETWTALGERLPDSATFLLCVGPADRYCGRICCSVSLKQALALKRLRPQMRVTVLFKDIRTYGFKERLYSEARQAGVIFIRYEPPAVPEITPEGDRVTIRVQDSILGEPLTLHSEVVVLAMPIVPRPDAHSPRP